MPVFVPDYSATGLATKMWTNCQWALYVYYISMDWTVLSFWGFDPTSWPNKVLRIRSMIHYTRLERLERDKHFTLSGPFVRCKENEVLWMRPKIPSPEISWCVSFIVICFVDSAKYLAMAWGRYSNNFQRIFNYFQL